MKISVVIPAYNDSRKLERLLVSLKKQTFKDFEIIVVDDASADNTYDVAKKYANKVIRNNRNQGPAITRNIGIKNSDSSIIAFTDSDCEASLNWLENILNHFSDKKIAFYF